MSHVLPHLEEKLRSLPQSPGVYLMKDQAGSIFYIGKARNLRSRLRTYFSGQDERPFVAILDTLLADIEVVLTHNDKEAFLLENELIKREQPRFNVKLTDDKNFLRLRLDTRQQYPRLEVVRRFAQDGATYFGPYPSAHAIRETLRVVNRHFQLRTCSDHVLHSRRKPCLQYQIKRCSAPCVFDLSDGAYKRQVNDVVTFLRGRRSELVQALKQRMQEKSANLEYEAAARLRDQIHAIERSLERQRLISPDFANHDVLGYFRAGPAAEIHLMRTRQGRLIGAERFSFRNLEVDTEEMLGEFTARYYTQPAVDLPDEVILPLDTGWADTLAQVLSDAHGRKVRVAIPKRGLRKKWIDLAMRNAHQAFQDQQRQQETHVAALEELRKRLQLREAPQIIECIDISHFQGDQIVGSCVRLTGGEPSKAHYRRYRVRSLENQDDYAALYEVVGRRLRRGLENSDLPDLLVIDGGKGQLQAARAAFHDHGVDEVDLVSLAKARSPTDNAQPKSLRTQERVFLLDRKDPVVLSPHSAALVLLTHARDEAHRFAITYQRQQRQQKSARSWLDSIPGIGPKRRQHLLRTFGSVAGVRQASFEDLCAVVGKNAAAAIKAAEKSSDEG